MKRELQDLKVQHQAEQQIRERKARYAKEIHAGLLDAHSKGMEKRLAKKKKKKKTQKKKKKKKKIKNKNKKFTTASDEIKESDGLGDSKQSSSDRAMTAMTVMTAMTAMTRCGGTAGCMRILIQAAVIRSIEYVQ